MTSSASPVVALQFDEGVAAAVRSGLTARRKHLPAWLFYDSVGSRLFDRITELEEYYLTRTERAIFAANAEDIIAQAAGQSRLRIAELGAGSADKTRLLLRAAVEQQESVVYEPIDVSASALEMAHRRIENEIPGVHVVPRVMDYTDDSRFSLEPAARHERRLVLYIGSSIGNFEPHQAAQLLRRVRAGQEPGDSILLGVDLVKDEATLLNAYNDAAGVTAAFNRNVLVRLNRELDADFDLDTFAHRAVWNSEQSRIEMHLESTVAQRVHIAAIDLTISFSAGETIHTENSYKYTRNQVTQLLQDEGFRVDATCTDSREWFAVCLGIAS